MDQTPLADVSVDKPIAGGLGRRGTPHGPFRRFLRRFIHFFSYHLILARQNIRVTRAAGFRLTVRPTVFHPRYFISSERFAEFIRRACKRDIRKLSARPSGCAGLAGMGYLLAKNIQARGAIGV